MAWRLTGVRANAALCAAFLLVLGACADGGHADSPTYRAGFGDGCATASASSGVPREPQRNAALYASDADYRAGWASGNASCRTNSAGAPFGTP